MAGSNLKAQRWTSIAGSRICANCKLANPLLLNTSRGNQIQESAKIAGRELNAPDSLKGVDFRCVRENG